MKAARKARLIDAALFALAALLFALGALAWWLLFKIAPWQAR